MVPGVTISRADRGQFLPSDKVALSRERELMASKWFESVAVAQRRARNASPGPSYAPSSPDPKKDSRRGQPGSPSTCWVSHRTWLANKRERTMATTVMANQSHCPVLISPTGVQAVHPDGEVAVARAAANRGVAMGSAHSPVALSKRSVP